MNLRKNILIGLLIFLYALLEIMMAQEPRFFSLSNFEGSLNFQFQVTNEENNHEGRFQYDLYRGFLEGGIRLNTSGSIYHPNFLSFWIDANIVWNQTKNRWISDASIHNSLNNTYNVRLQLFNKKRIYIEFFTLNNYSTTERRFQGRFFQRFKSTGINVHSSARIFPFDLYIYNNHNTIDALTYSERDEKIKNIDFRMDFIRAGKTGAFLTLKKKDYAESVYDADYKSFEVLGNFHHNYGPGSRNNVTSLLSFNKMTGNYDFELLRFMNNSLYHLKQNLYLRGSYLLTKDRTYEYSLVKNEFSGTLIHQLFQSLTSSGLLGGRFENSTLQRRNTFLGEASFNYRKKIPTGNVSLFFSRRFENAVITSKGDIQYEVRHFDFSFSDTITLMRPGISPESIQVTAPDLSHIYILDIDYQINVINNVIYITRLLGGDIPEDGTVAVHYSYFAYPDYRQKSRFLQFNFMVIFLRYLRVYYRKLSTHHNISSQFTIPPFDSFDRQTVAFKFFSNILNTEYALETYDSLLSNYRGNHFRTSVAVRFFKSFRFSGNISLSRIKYEGGILFNRYQGYSANLSFDPGPKFHTQAVYRKIKYEIPGFFRNRESMLFKLQWRFRKVELELFYEHILDGYQQDERLHDFFSLILRRRF